MEGFIRFVFNIFCRCVFFFFLNCIGVCWICCFIGLLFIVLIECLIVVKFFKLNLFFVKMFWNFINNSLSLFIFFFCNNLLELYKMFLKCGGMFFSKFFDWVLDVFFVFFVVYLYIFIVWVSICVRFIMIFLFDIFMRYIRGLILGLCNVSNISRFWG